MAFTGECRTEIGTLQSSSGDGKGFQLYYRYRVIVKGSDFCPRLQGTPAVVLDKIVPIQSHGRPGQKVAV